MTNEHNSTLYVGVTSDLKKRIWQHKEKIVKGFTEKYNISKLVYYELSDTAEAAITREKQIKAGSRHKKIMLIKTLNPLFEDLYLKV
ncbi:MAG: GIY-YIG nuclease family protein [Elusimicrobiota bacterium]|jgi:putative endonuclease|nr:GIY-YIG nuclease family protein [Elusimicrobiota bacterium]